jgi:hypothetical protein
LDCSNSIPHLEKINPTYDIVRFGRPLWGSQWSGQTAETDQEDRFDEILRLAKSKLTGGALKWSEIQEDTIKRRVALALLACTAALYVSPTSSVAPELVKSHMATLVAVDDERERHLITYPSEPLLPEASMELLSEKGVEIVVLKELDAAYKSGGILDAGDQGELAVKLLLLGAWRRLICTERRTNKGILFSARRPVMSFLRELFDSEGLSKVKLPKIDDFDIGFTHFISINHKPNQETVEAIWERRGAIHFKRNQQGADLGLIIKHRTTSQFGAIVFQVCNIGTYFIIGFRFF